MPSLDPTLRKSLENKIPAVRQIAEEAARAILNTLAVNRLEPFPGMTPDQRKLRNALRAKARQLGEGSQTAGFEPLVEELAYQQWHRMVFARFLAENQLLMHPTGVPVSLQECGELVQEESEVDAWAVASKYATLMLPGIFRPNDPESQVRLTPEGQQKLEKALNDIEQPVFLADDALGWMYQFWQKVKKDEINKSERKIGGADLSPVTQLFTEDYMVSFLLENSLGAWWAARHPESPLIKGWKYLRFKEDGSPAGGTFPGWPERAALVTVMDPCFGSGHFLVAGFQMLAAMRVEEEGLDAAAAGDAVLRDNLFGLELDPRCTQIGAFALALAAWKSGGYRLLPVPNLACSGTPVQGQLDTWLKLAGEDSRMRAGLERLYNLFKNAPDLGSLINPADLPAVDRMFTADFDKVVPVLEQALAKEHSDEDPAADIFNVITKDITKAARIMVGNYSLVITNVPYLSRAKHGDLLKGYCDIHHPIAKHDLATCFLERCIKYTSNKGIIAIITPQSWLFLNSYEKLRASLLSNVSFKSISYLGENSFWSSQAAGAFPVLLIGQKISPNKGSTFMGIDVSTQIEPSIKAEGLINNSAEFVSQFEQISNPNHRIAIKKVSSGKLLNNYAQGLHGQGSFDDPCYVMNFWEMPKLLDGWIFQQTTGSEARAYYSGCTNVFRWENGQGMLYRYMQEMAKKGYTTGKWKAGIKAWGKRGIAIGGMRKFFINLYSGESFDTNLAVILPNNEEDLDAIWHFCISDKFHEAVREIDRNLKVSCNTYVKVPFDINHWRKIAQDAELIPDPVSDNPTQWLFTGHPKGAIESLQVAAMRLLDYNWPKQLEDELDPLADEDGIVCLVPTAGERPLTERLRELLAAAYGGEWSPHKQAELLSAAGAAGKSLEEWLRDDFFAAHCRLFHNRPFLWHIWDGRKDGFSALVNYHKLDGARLDKLIFTYLGDWIRFQRARRDHGEPGADGRLVAALELERKLKLIKEGEPPYDIYVRWKSLAQQPIGWDPDLNDGVRLNIRPFVMAGVLRSKFTINWNKDRGKNPDGSERLNGVHLNRAEKLEARKQGKSGG